MGDRFLKEKIFLACDNSPKTEENYDFVYLV